MARMHARCRGKSGSKPPIGKKHPEWSLSKKEVESLIVEMSEKGTDMAKIGLILRDQYGVPDIKAATGKSLLTMLQEKNMQPEIPEDLGHLIKKTEVLKTHLQANPKDLHNKRSLALIEAKIRRLVKYYTRTRRLPEGWKY